MIKYIMTDVEGTTTSISFVHETLFPFAKKRLADFCCENANSEIVKEALSLTKETVKTEEAKEINNEEAIEKLLYWIQTDRKHPALKSLQGYIWEEGYKSGVVKGHIYDDVPAALLKWKNAGLTLGVYSSGSVKAQHLIYEYSDKGNLRPFFSFHFDTKVGHKRETNSYENIVKELKTTPESILFLSDIKEELDAARAVGLKTIQLVRQDDVILGDHPKVHNFSEITF